MNPLDFFVRLAIAEPRLMMITLILSLVILIGILRERKKRKT